MDKLFQSVHGKENLIEVNGISLFESAIGAYQPSFRKANFSPSPTATPTGPSTGASTEPTLNLLTVTQAGLPAHNTRVRLRRAEFEEDVVGENDPDAADDGADVPDRESIKRASAQV
ncbi:hypothetical protein HDU93_007638, partial [Gonapodya sp. JEL0774]